MNIRLSAVKLTSSNIAVVSWMISSTFLVFQLYLQLSMGALSEVLTQDFLLNTSSYGILSSSFYFFYIIMQLPSGLLVKKWGPHRLIMYGSGFCAIGCLFFAFSKSVGMALIGRTLIGLGASSAFVCCVNITGGNFSKNKVGFMLGIAETMMMLGTWTGVNLLSYALRLIHWRSGMFFNAMVGFSISFLASIFISEEEKQTIELISPSLIFLLFKEKIIWFNGIYIGLIFSSVTVLASTWAVPYLMKKQSISHSYAVLEASWTYIGAACASPIVGQIQRFKQEGISIYIVTAFLSLISLMFLIFTNFLTIIMGSVIFFVLGITASISVLNYSWVQNNMNPALSSLAIGLTNMLALLVIPVLHCIIGLHMTL